MRDLGVNLKLWRMCRREEAKRPFRHLRRRPPGRRRPAPPSATHPAASSAEENRSRTNARRRLTIEAALRLTSPSFDPPPERGKTRPLIGCAGGGLGANDRAASVWVRS
ncbi:hypothetical protein H8959_011618 [Pygathrix nigripes]